MKVMTLLVLASLSAAARADDFLCTGTSWLKGESYGATTVFHLEPKTLLASVATYNGRASGVAKMEPDLYMGLLVTASGVEYWFNLHRYTGELYYGTNDKSGAPIGRGEFVGKCEPAKPKF